MASDRVKQVRALQAEGFVIQEVFGAQVSTIWYAILSRPPEDEAAETSTVWILLEASDVSKVQDLMLLGQTDD